MLRPHRNEGDRVRDVIDKEFRARRNDLRTMGVDHSFGVVFSGSHRDFREAQVVRDVDLGVFHWLRGIM